MRLDHVALTVSDRERSARFYGEYFGLTKRLHDDEHLLILGDGRGSVLALSSGVPAAERLPNSNHFGFRAETRDEVLAARERFRTVGIAETEWQDEPGLSRVQVADPDGYRIDLYTLDAAGF